MADNVLKSYLISLGFKTSGQAEAKRSVEDYEKAVVQAEKSIEDARWAGAKTQEDIAKLTRETNLRLAREALDRAKAAKKAEEEEIKRREEAHRKLKLGLLGIAAAAAAAGAALAASVGKWAEQFDQVGAAARRVGTTVSGLRSLEAGFRRAGASPGQASASLDSFATASRNNPGVRQLIRDRGVDTNLPIEEQYLGVIRSLAHEKKEVGVALAEVMGIGERDFDFAVRNIGQIDASMKGPGERMVENVR